jgi:predicted amino acid-binding ACT domain protein
LGKVDKKEGKDEFCVTKRQNHHLPMKQSLVEQVSKVLAKVPIVENLARRKFICLFVLGLIKSRNVQFCEIAQHFNDEAKLSSNEVRIQDFFREVDIDYFFVAALLVSLLPAKGKLRLCIDRTEWDFGACRVNILMVIAVKDAMQVPLYWQLLDNNSGNSSSEDRIELLKMCIKLLGKDRIGLVIGDREFIGHRWMKYLKDNSLLFVMRLPKHHLIERLDGRKQHLTELTLSITKPLLLSDCLIDGVVGHVWVKTLPDGDYLFLFGTAKVEYFGGFYPKRWTIECVFQAFKKRGFNLENTHLKVMAKLKKLVALVAIAYSICVSMGIYQHQKVQKIKN